ncbi:MAG: eL32 family ribosomal protein [Candidatus Micrarchaeia archaeon]
MKVAKKEKPRFTVQNLGAKNRKRVKDRWRAPRGIDNKLRIKKKFHGNMPGIGYKNPEQVRFRDEKGVLEVLVHNEKELLALAGKEQTAARLYHALSSRKKEYLSRLAKEKGIEVRI